MNIKAIILAGGKGERFWPKSREGSPKQCLDLWGGHTMIEQTVDRILPVVGEGNVIISTGEDVEPVLRNYVPDEEYAIEPMGRNTAASIGLSCLKVEPETIVIILPSDHLIKAVKEFQEDLKLCVEKSKDDKIVVLGIKPARPATGYGYIKLGKRIENKVFEVEAFVEKPDKKKAQAYVKSKGYLWNAGMFISKASVMLDAIKKHMPELHRGLVKIKEAEFDPRVAKDVFSKLENISIDYGVMEKADNLLIIEAGFDWDDVGNWSALGRVFDQDENGNVIVGQAKCLDTKDCIIYGDKMVGAIGVKNLIIVNTPDAVLVCDKNDAEKVRELVKRLGEEYR
jgi:mannose-1-phosphate guanylyltransferase